MRAFSDEIEQKFYMPIACRAISSLPEGYEISSAAAFILAKSPE